MKKAILFLLIGLCACAQTVKYNKIDYTGSMNTNFDMVRFITYPPEIYGLHWDGAKYHKKIVKLSRRECADLVQETISTQAAKFDDEDAKIGESYVIDYWHYYGSFCIPEGTDVEECGMNWDSDEQSLPIPTTPFVCDKYNSNNPVPYTKWY
jgi:hypothetical protein